MISGLFFLQLLLTFATGSVWIYLTVYSSVHFGSKTGGFIGGLPSTALLSFFFIGYTQSPELASEATTIFPLAMGVTGLFLVVFAWVARWGFFWGLTVGLLAWFIFSFVIVLFHPGSFYLNLLVYTLVIAFTFYILDKRLQVRALAARKKDQALTHMVQRSLFGGLIITLTVFIAKIGGPFLGGIFAGFPAMFIATLTVTYRVQGIDFARAITKPLLVTAMVTIALYAISLRYFYLSAGLYYGTLFSIVVAAVSAYLTFRFILPRLT
jgi:hypothetical protein